MGKISRSTNTYQKLGSIFLLEEKRENWETSAPGDEDREVVSWYTPRAREGREVVSYYVQSTPLPEKARSIAQPGTKKKKKSRRGLWIFLDNPWGKDGKKG